MAPYLKWHGLTLIPGWISNSIQYEVWDEITYPSLNRWSLGMDKVISSHMLVKGPKGFYREYCKRDGVLLIVSSSLVPLHLRILCNYYHHHHHYYITFDIVVIIIVIIIIVAIELMDVFKKIDPPYNY